jgi:hypothetical protein
MPTTYSYWVEKLQNACNVLIGDRTLGWRLGGAYNELSKVPDQNVPASVASEFKSWRETVSKNLGRLDELEDVELSRLARQVTGWLGSLASDGARQIKP